MQDHQGHPAAAALGPLDPLDPRAMMAGMDVLGHQVDFVGWPHIIIARVSGLVDWRWLLCLEGGFRLGLEHY
jgi:hypothetical protein